LLCRKIEDDVIKAAAVVGKMRTTTLVAKIREKILKSEHPQGVIHMRKIDALRQARVFWVLWWYLKSPTPTPRNLQQKNLN
jgi:hypothetical protein